MRGNFGPRGDKIEAVGAFTPNIPWAQRIRRMIACTLSATISARSEWPASMKAKFTRTAGGGVRDVTRKVHRIEAVEMVLPSTNGNESGI